MTESLTPTGFFVLRAPLLPLEELDRLRADPDYWHRLAARPEVREALYLASPGLARRLAVGDPEPRVKAAVTAYLVRMCTRATPFGLFAATAVGRIDDVTTLTIDGPESITRRSRPDTEVLTGLVQRLLADPATRPAMRVEPNSSRYRAAGTLRLIDRRFTNGARTHHLIAVEDDPPLQHALQAAGSGATIEHVISAVAAHTGAARDEAREYVDALVDTQVLTPVAEPAVTGPEPLAQIRSHLRQHGLTQTSQLLDRVSDHLDMLDRTGLGNSAQTYDAMAHTLLELGGDDEARLVQVDLHRSGSDLRLAPEVIKQLTEAVHLLHSVNPDPEDDALRKFKTAFRARYDALEIPLTRALDEETGVGYDRCTHPAADDSPLLAGLDLGGVSASTRSWSVRDAALLDMVIRVRESRSRSLELDTDNLARLAVPGRPALPDALAVRATLLDDGHIEIPGAFGPSGAQQLGRFCHGDPRLYEAVRTHLRAEEALAPGVVFAEIVHLPEGRLGNILARPVLRDYELVLMGRSGAPAQRQIRIDELTVRLDGDRVVLFCPRLNAEVRPRMTTAHNPSYRGFGLYRFLTALQNDGVTGALGWTWGALESAPALPRVTAGTLVLARARWRLNVAELESITGADAAAGWHALTARRGLPRELLVVDADNRLYVDTSSPALIAAAAKVLRGEHEAVVEETLDSRVAAGPQGHFSHELIVPLVRQRDAVPAPKPPPAPRVRRTFAPGSEWLYLKVYTGTASADRILTASLGPVLAELRNDEVIDHWFFLRYADPEPHLRIRLHGDPAALDAAALPRLTAALTPYLDDGTVWNVALDSYHREIERYGGDNGIELAEHIHAADSDAVIETLNMLDGDDGAQARWKLSLYATHRLLIDAGLTTAARRDWARAGAARYRTEYPDAPNLESGIGRRWRDDRADLTTLLDDTAPHPYEPGRAVFRRRSRLITPLLDELADRSRRGMLSQPIEVLLHSFSHLNAVRLLRSAARTHELVLLSFLDRYYASQIARTPPDHDAW